MPKEKVHTEGNVSKSELDKMCLELQHLNEQLAVMVTRQLQKTELIKNIKRQLEKLEKNSNQNQVKLGIGRLIRMIDFDDSMENQWDQFSIYFDSATQNFLQRLGNQYPQLSPKDHKLCAYLRLNPLLFGIL